MTYLALVAQAAAILLMVYVVWYDIRNLKITNTSVLILLALYLPAQGLLGFPALWDDVFAGALLFVLGFVMWMLRALGAGDSKLMLPLGLHLSYVGLLPFTILLLIFSVFFYIAITLSAWFGAERGLFGWLAMLKRTGKLPYGLPLAVAAIPVMVVRILWFAAA